MGAVLRFDYGTVSQVERTPQGFLRIPVIATKPGVFTYRRLDGTVVRELRHPDDVFHPDSLASLAGAPLTFEHPPVMINPSNSRLYARGWTGEQVTGSELGVNATAVVTDAELMDAIERGLREVSAGYSALLVEDPGIWNGQPYDVRQTNIRYNHLAVTKKGRLGPDVRLRMDADAAVMHDCCEHCKTDGAEFESCVSGVEKTGGANPYAVCTAAIGQKKDAKTMQKIMLNGQEYDVSPEVAAAFQAHMAAMAAEKKSEMDAAAAPMAALQTKCDTAEAASAEAVKRAETAEAKADGLKSDLEKSQAAVAARVDSVDPAKLSTLVKARIGLERVAGFVLPADKAAKISEMTDADLRAEVIRADSPTADLTGKSETYVEVRYDAVAEKVRARPEFNSGAAPTVVVPHMDGNPLSADAGREKMIQEQSAAWKVSASA